jgi:hypothetical protein
MRQENNHELRKRNDLERSHRDLLEGGNKIFARNYSGHHDEPH